MVVPGTLPRSSSPLANVHRTACLQHPLTRALRPTTTRPSALTSPAEDSSAPGRLPMDIILAWARADPAQAQMRRAGRSGVGVIIGSSAEPTMAHLQHTRFCL